VGSGLVASFARPGGNVTGSTFNARGLAAKRLELIREAVPKLQTIGVLSYLVDPIARAQVDELQKSAKALGVRLVVREVRRAEDLGAAVDGAVVAGAEAIMVTQESLFYSHRARIVGLAAKHSLPGVYLDEGFVREGGLLSFNVSVPQLWTGSADYVDRVLKGAKPADLPVQQPTEFMVAVNNKTAKALGVTIPKSVLVRATTIVD
jgi:putative tryptophan/tyrosine transport system substrate-binding protein